MPHAAPVGAVENWKLTVVPVVSESSSTSSASARIICSPRPR